MLGRATLTLFSLSVLGVALHRATETSCLSLLIAIFRNPLVNCILECFAFVCTLSSLPRALLQPITGALLRLVRSTYTSGKLA